MNPQSSSIFQVTGHLITVLLVFTVQGIYAASKTYYFHTTSAHWNTASATCEAYGATLASITSQEENDILENLKQQHGFSVHGYWIGLHRSISAGGFVWADCSSTSLGGFSQWYGGAPGNDSCVKFLKSQIGWHTSVCSDGVPFICEKNEASCLSSCLCGYTFHGRQTTLTSATNVKTIANRNLTACKDACENQTGGWRCTYLLHDPGNSECVLLDTEASSFKEAGRYDGYTRNCYEGQSPQQNLVHQNSGAVPLPDACPSIMPRAVEPLTTTPNVLTTKTSTDAVTTSSFSVFSATTGQLTTTAEKVLTTSDNEVMTRTSTVEGTTTTENWSTTTRSLTSQSESNIPSDATSTTEAPSDYVTVNLTTTTDSSSTSSQSKVYDWASASPSDVTSSASTEISSLNNYQERTTESIDPTEISKRSYPSAPTTIKSTNQTTIATESAATTTTVTSSLQTEMSAAQTGCYCPCSVKYSEEKKKRFLNDILDELDLDKTSTSAHVRRLTSAPDPRPSAQAIGCSGLVMLLAVIVGIFILDFSTLIREVSLLFQNIRDGLRSGKETENYEDSSDSICVSSPNNVC